MRGVERRRSGRGLGFGLGPILAGLLAIGCGYALVGRGSTLPEDIRTIFVVPMENRTNRVQLEQILTQALTDEIVTRRRFSIVRGQSEADAVLEGAVTSFRVTPVAFDQDGRGQEYEISIVAKMKFQRAGSDDVIWQNDHYLFRESYEIDSSEESFFDRENLAIDEAALRFAETMVSDLFEGF